MKGTIIIALITLTLTPLFRGFKISSDVKNNTKAAGCQIDTRQMPLNTPLLLSLSTRDILYPDYGGSVINLSRNEQIEIDCPGGANLVVAGVTISELSIATCVSGLEFAIAGQVVDFSTVLCSSRIRSAAYYTGSNCLGTGKEIEAGFDIRDGRFLQQYTACFDDQARNVLYTRFILSKQIGAAITGGTSPTWQEDDFYNLGDRVNNIYPKVAHRATINKLIGLAEDDTKYVHATAKGHLTARTDFNYNAQQMSTFHYINSAPQWQTFNALNWYFLERDLRLYAGNNFVELIVYTGTYGVTTLPHAVTGEDVELYLYVDDNGNKAMPIPELFWKVAYDPLTKAGVAVLGINNPYQEHVEKSVICNDIADELTWLNFDRFNVARGYLYACTIDDFRRVVPHVPEYEVLSILN
ncbi:hypothetical protein NQ318_021500 [Aromia moschata]|uniref:DNA/RNA non-specific endonuclease/pyrophosphatase/phosphodiesterase domain-containing protein n=1 Tax=Aromia moschata TaxID=1265417 RepID=A0AAV8ZCL8_9CUCU|nr:hypothetical protein NQ318_021500 [Aromia moschata]